MSEENGIQEIYLISSLYEEFDVNLNDFTIVMDLESTEREANENGLFSYIEVDGDTIIYSSYYIDHFSSGTRYYRRIVWQRGKGITHYVSGIGFFREHVEFGTDLLETYPYRWVGGKWIEE